METSVELGFLFLILMLAVTLVGITIEGWCDKKKKKKDEKIKELMERVDALSKSK